MVATGVPDWPSSVAVKWRRSWRRTDSRPSVARSRPKRLVQTSGRHGVAESGSSLNRNALSSRRTRSGAQLLAAELVLAQQLERRAVDGHPAGLVGLGRLLDDVSTDVGDVAADQQLAGVPGDLLPGPSPRRQPVVASSHR